MNGVLPKFFAVVYRQVKKSPLFLCNMYKYHDSSVIILYLFVRVVNIKIKNVEK